MPGMDNAHALVVGIARYKAINPLPETVLKDAQDVHDVLVHHEYCGYAAGNVELLLDQAATGEALRTALATLASRSDTASNVFVYLSCHGGRIESGPHAGEYILPADVDYASNARMAGTAISGTELTEALRAIEARKLTIVFDCCHSGGIGQPKDATTAAVKSGLSDRYYDQLKQGRGRAILASSRSDELSWILDGAENSVFTGHLLGAMRGGAPGPGGLIRIFDVFDYVQPRVTADQPNQHPVFKAEIEENYAVALHLGGKKAAAPEPAPALADGYEYDVFISYSSTKEDRRWVRKALLPHLEGAGLRVAVDFRAPLGVPKITFREQAVQGSRYTVLLLSPTFLESGYSDFESLVAQHLGLEESAYRLLPLMIEDCTPRLGLRILPMLDMSDEDEFEDNIDRLLYQLGQPPTPRSH